MYWFGPNGGFTLDYPSIVIHAIARTPRPHIYLQLNNSDHSYVGVNGGVVTGVSVVEDDDEGSAVAEMYLYPTDPHMGMMHVFTHIDIQPMYTLYHIDFDVLLFHLRMEQIQFGN